MDIALAGGGIETRIILAGVIGPASDGYATDKALNSDVAFPTIATKPLSLQDSMSIFSTRRLIRRFQNCLVSPALWRKPAGHMHWHRCCTRTAGCSMERHSQMQSPESMPTSLPFRVIT
jgi:hypothetical protein